MVEMSLSELSLPLARAEWFDDGRVADCMITFTLVPEVRRVEDLLEGAGSISQRFQLVANVC